MKAIIAEHDARMDSALTKLTNALSAVATAQHEAMNAAQAAFISAMETSLQDGATAMQEFTAEAESIIKSARAAIAEKTADYFGEAPPRLPVATTPEFQLIVTNDEANDQRVHPSIALLAARVVTDGGEVLKEAHHDAPVPSLSMHYTEIEEVARLNDLNLSSPRDAIKAIGYAWARKAARIDAAGTAAVESASQPPVQQAAE